MSVTDGFFFGRGPVYRFQRECDFNQLFPVHGSLSYFDACLRTYEVGDSFDCHFYVLLASFAFYWGALRSGNVVNDSLAFLDQITLQLVELITKFMLHVSETFY